MPELPELQALSERLHDALAGHELRRADALQFSALKTVTPSPFDLVGKRITSVERRGKYVIFDFEDARMLVHLAQGGRIDFEMPPKMSKPKGAVARFGFDDAPSILVKEYGTERKAAWWVLDAHDDGPMSGLGPEPFDDAFVSAVSEAKDRRHLNTFLRDQKTVAGIGRGFSDDILHHARLSPFATIGSLNDEQRRRLVDSTRSVLEEATERERSRTGGLPAKMGNRFRIHNHNGQPCPRCGDTLQRVSYESREVVYCPTCQTEGKVLADRRLSRLIK
jgi:formamidopyrimidine-DNA glycosylase